MLALLLQNNYFQEKFQGGLATLQGKLENLDLRAENHNMKENAEQKAKYQVYPVFPANS
jgi:hypothetical protein